MCAAFILELWSRKWNCLQKRGQDLGVGRQLELHPGEVPSADLPEEAEMQFPGFCGILEMRSNLSTPYSWLLECKILFEP